MVTTLTVDGYATCAECGQKGATPSGLCLACCTKAIGTGILKSRAARAMRRAYKAGTDQTTEERDIVKKALEVAGAEKDEAEHFTLEQKAMKAASAQLQDVLLSNWADAWASMKEAYEAHCEAHQDDEKPFSFGIGLKVNIVPHGGEFDVNAEVAWSVKHKDSTTGQTVSDQLDMFDKKM